MAIKIPSKNIYEMNNPKIRDNVIDNVSVEQTIVKPNNEYETPVYNEDIMDFSTEQTSSDPNGKDIGVNAYAKGYPIAGAGVLHYGVGAYCAFNNYKKTNNFSIKIPKLKNNNFINKLYYGKDEEGNSNIKYTISGYINMGTASSTFTYNLPLLSELVLNPSTITYGSPESGDDIKIEIPKKETYSYSGTFGTDTISATANATFYNSGTILTAKPSDLIENGIEYYILNFNIISGWRVVKMGGYQVLILGGSGDFPMSGTYEEYIPTQIEITIYGNTIGIDLTNGSITYGSGNKPFLLSNNELMQYKETINYANVKGFSHNGDGLTINGNENNLLVVNGTCIDPIPTIDRYFVNLGIVNLPKGRYILKGMPKAVGLSALYLEDRENGAKIAESFYEPIEFSLEKEKSLNFYFVASNGDTFNNFIIVPKITNINNLEYLANNILNQYAKGKETATLLCSISDYYDESGEKVIDTKTNKMSFRLHDEVIPYVFGADGQDKPMSKYQDGSAKVFEVVGSNIIYDGAVWQELTLQEI